MMEQDGQALAALALPRLRAWLNDPAAEVTSVAASANGFSARTIIATLRSESGASQEIVMRFEHPGMEIFLGTDIAEQARVASALVRHDIPAPRIIGVETDQSAAGCSFMAMERASGRGFPQSPSYLVAGWVKELAPEARTRLWEGALSVLGRIGRLDWREGFAFLDRPDYGATGLDQYLGWLRAWRNDVLGNDAHAIIDAGLDHLEKHRPDDLPVSVIWGDSNPGNMLFNDDLSVGAILDFEAAALGPAEIDLGWWLFLDRRRSSGLPEMAGKPDRDQCIAIVERSLGRPVQAIDYFEIMGGVRMSLVVARTISRLKERGALPAANNAALHNPIAGMLARLLGLPEAESGQDFHEFVAAVSRR